MWIRKILETLTNLGSSGTKLLLPSWLLGFQHKEEETIFTMLTAPSDPRTRGASRRSPLDWPRPGPKNQLASSMFKSQLTAFFFKKSPKILNPSLPGMTSFTSPVLFPIRGFYYDICDCHILPARAWTPALNVCPYPCTKPNSSKPN